MLLHDVLKLGYAVVNSTGLRTNTHYNLQLGGETALMLKEHFIEDHGVPLYSVGVGGSGGAIQQYVYAQNHPGLLDAAIPQYSYSDMITQTIHVGDCELLEHYYGGPRDRGRRPRLGRDPRRRAAGGVRAALPDPQELAHRGWRSDRGRHRSPPKVNGSRRCWRRRREARHRPPPAARRIDRRLGR
jgi:Tannase-like family of unknown function (DUF6351)